VVVQVYSVNSDTSELGITHLCHPCSRSDYTTYDHCDDTCWLYSMYRTMTGNLYYRQHYRQTGWQSYGAPSGVEWEKERDGEETEPAYQNAWRHVAATAAAAAAPACSGKPRTIGVWYPMIRRHDIHSRPVWTEPTVKKWWGNFLETSIDLDNNETFV